MTNRADKINFIKNILITNEPTPNFADAICKGLKEVDDKGVDYMFNYINTHPVGNGSHIIEVLNNLWGIPVWNEETRKFEKPKPLYEENDR